MWTTRKRLGSGREMTLLLLAQLVQEGFGFGFQAFCVDRESACRTVQIIGRLRSLVDPLDHAINVVGDIGGA
mgnify:CR=1 FL=1